LVEKVAMGQAITESFICDFEEKLEEDEDEGGKRDQPEKSFLCNETTPTATSTIQYYAMCAEEEEQVETCLENRV
jgi:hypothetical protein